MKHLFREAKLADGWLCLKVENRAQARRFTMDMQQGKAYGAELTLHRERRSLDANAYFWMLCGKLAAVLGVHRDELYRELVRGIGDNFRIWTIPDKDVPLFRLTWRNHGLGWICETVDSAGGQTKLRCYYGSSDYDTAQMSRLIDLVVQECREQEIETLPPDKLLALKEAWTGE